MRFFPIVLCLLVSACSNLPKTISKAPLSDIQVPEVANKSAMLAGQPVRWGGIITEVVNNKDSTGVQVLSYPLGSYGRPRDKKETGRFYFQTPQFLDPAVYKLGREITVFGYLNGETDKTIGEKTLTLPVVEAKDIHLWPSYRRSYYRDPGYWPYYSYGFYGRYHPYSRFGLGYSGFYGYRACY